MRKYHRQCATQIYVWWVGAGAGGVAWVKVNPGRWNVKDTRQRPPCDCFMTAVRILNIAILTDRGSPAATHSFSPSPPLSFSFASLCPTKLTYAIRESAANLILALSFMSCPMSRPQGQTIGASLPGSYKYVLYHTHTHTYIYIQQQRLENRFSYVFGFIFRPDIFIVQAKSEEIRMKLDLLHRIDFICFDLFPKIRKLDAKPRTR